MAMLPLVAPAFDALWTFLSVNYFESLTDRRFHGLAALHYLSPPEMVFHPGGERIFFWTTTAPAAGSLTMLVVCAATLLAFQPFDVERRAVVWVAVAALLAVALMTVYVGINVTGLYI